MRPGNLGHGTLTLRILELEPWECDRDTQDPENGSLELGTCDPENQYPESSTLRIELVTQIPNILTCITDEINFSCEVHFDNKKLGHLSRKLGCLSR